MRSTGYGNLENNGTNLARSCHCNDLILRYFLDPPDRFGCEGWDDEANTEHAQGDTLSISELGSEAR